MPNPQEPIEWQLSLFGDIGAERLTPVRHPRRRYQEDRPRPVVTYRGPKRDTRHAYDRPGDF